MKTGISNKTTSLLVLLISLSVMKQIHASEMTLLAYYMAAVREKEREHLPWCMVHKLCRDDTVKGMVCFVRRCTPMSLPGTACGSRLPL